MGIKILKELSILLEKVFRKQKCPYNIEFGDYHYHIIPYKVEMKREILNMAENLFKNIKSWDEIDFNRAESIISRELLLKYGKRPDISMEAIGYLIKLKAAPLLNREQIKKETVELEKEILKKFGATA